MRSAIEKEALLGLSLLLFSRSAVRILLLPLHFVDTLRTQPVNRVIPLTITLHFIKLLSLMDSFSSGRHEFLQLISVVGLPAANTFPRARR